MAIKINTDKSYLGKDIREWLDNDHETYNEIKDQIREKYYSDDVKYKPSDEVYYFIEHISLTDSICKVGSTRLAGSRLYRDEMKSPRKSDKKSSVLWSTCIMYYKKLVEKKSIIVDGDTITYVSDNEIYVKSEKPIINRMIKESIQMTMDKDNFLHNYLWNKLIRMSIKEIIVDAYLETL